MATHRQDPYPADKARQGDVVLRKRWQRWVFVLGIVGLMVVALLSTWMLGGHA